MNKYFVDPDQVLKDFSILAEYCHPQHIRLCGGEPLLHPHLLDVVDAVRDSGISECIRVVTNGTLLHRMPDRFWQKVDQIHISLYPECRVTSTKIRNFQRLARKHDTELVVRYVNRFRESFSELGTTESDRPVVVGTERDLVGLEPVDLAVSLDADALVLAPNYRAREEALRLLARLALSVRAGRGRRCLVQTAMPDEPVIETLRSGRPLPFQRAVVREREDWGFPPVGEMIAVETSGAGGEIDVATLAPNATVLGPAATDTGQRWLIQGSELRDVRIRLRTVVQDLRDRGVTVRIDADPLDL